MRILVTGANGFVGRHLVHDLREAGHAPLSFDTAAHPGIGPKDTFTGDLRDPEALNRVAREARADACVHLAGIAFVPMGWKDPELVFSVNALGTVNLLEAFRLFSPATRLVVVTSAEVYGKNPGWGTLTEDAPMNPSNLYAVSKMVADLSALLYARRYEMPVVTARPQNHIGPGQSSQFVATAFAEQLGRIARREAEPVIRVGNLESERDFLDVRDVVRAYRLLAEKGRPGSAYNIASGRSLKIRRLLDELCALAGVQPKIEVDPARYRPTEKPPSVDTSRILRDAGWKAEIPIETTLRDIWLERKQGTASAT